MKILLLFLLLISPLHAMQHGHISIDIESGPNTPNSSPVGSHIARPAIQLPTETDGDGNNKLKIAGIAAGTTACTAVTALCTAVITAGVTVAITYNQCNK